MKGKLTYRVKVNTWDSRIALLNLVLETKLMRLQISVNSFVDSYPFPWDT